MSRPATSSTASVPVLAAGLAVAIVVNVAQFAAIELETGDEYEAVRVKAGHRVDDLVAGHFGSTRARFELYAQIRQLAPGASFDVADSELLVEELAGLALVDEVTRSTQPPPPLGDAAARLLDRSVVAEGEDERLGAYVIALAPGRPDRLTLRRHGDVTYVVDRRLVDELGQ